ncbi:MAG TPA: 5-deoxy-glucuronate isomerase, partial [Chloroflexia bacterium]|nr:5-deoxy-glucuronate isomerase [Chloroflexia bacterium]
MRQYDANNLIVHPGAASTPGVVVEVTPEAAGWDTISFQVRQRAAGERWAFDTGEHELALVPLSGIVRVESDHGSWPVV